MTRKQKTLKNNYQSLMEKRNVLKDRQNHLKAFNVTLQINLVLLTGVFIHSNLNAEQLTLLPNKIIAVCTVSSMVFGCIALIYKGVVNPQDNIKQYPTPEEFNEKATDYYRNTLAFYNKLQKTFAFISNLLSAFLVALVSYLIINPNVNINEVGLKPSLYFENRKYITCLVFLLTISANTLFKETLKQLFASKTKLFKKEFFRNNQEYLDLTNDIFNEKENDNHDNTLDFKIRTYFMRIIAITLPTSVIIIVLKLLYERTKLTIQFWKQYETQKHLVLLSILIIPFTAVISEILLDRHYLNKKIKQHKGVKKIENKHQRLVDDYYNERTNNALVLSGIGYAIFIASIAVFYHVVLPNIFNKSTQAFSQLEETALLMLITTSLSLILIIYTKEFKEKELKDRLSNDTQKLATRYFKYLNLKEHLILQFKKITMNLLIFASIIFDVCVLHKTFIQKETVDELTVVVGNSISEPLLTLFAVIAIPIVLKFVKNESVQKSKTKIETLREKFEKNYNIKLPVN